MRTLKTRKENVKSESGHAPLLRLLGAETNKTQKALCASWIETPLGPLVAVADEKALHLLEFADQQGLDKEMEFLRKKTKSTIVSGSTKPLVSIEKELKLYFTGKLDEFKTPLFFLGTPFQQNVWAELRKIPYGETRSYSEVAKSIGNPTAYRAVANANGSNKFVIVIPCHRVIHANGDLCGYNAGVFRKKWLLQHEKTQ